MTCRLLNCQNDLKKVTGQEWSDFGYCSNRCYLEAVSKVLPIMIGKTVAVNERYELPVQPIPKSEWMGRAAGGLKDTFYRKAEEDEVKEQEPVKTNLIAREIISYALSQLKQNKEQLFYSWSEIERVEEIVKKAKL